MNASRREFVRGSAAFLSAVLAGALRADRAAPFQLAVRRVRLEIGVPKPFTFIHFSDSHLTEATASELSAAGSPGAALHAKRTKILKKNAYAFAATIARIKSSGLFAVNTGDVLDYVSEGGLRAASAQLGLDILTTPGNHERTFLDAAKRPRSRKELDALSRRLTAAYGSECPVAAKVVAGVKFVTFDNSGVSSRSAALEALRREFADGLPMVFCCHFPPYAPELLAKERASNATKPASAWMMVGETVEGVEPKADDRAIVDFLKSAKNLKAVLSGHLHGFREAKFDGRVPIVVAPANYAGHILEVEVV